MGQFFKIGLLLCSALFSSQLLAVTYVPIKVGGITVIIPIDDPPVALGDSVTIDEDARTQINVLENDSDEAIEDIVVEVIRSTANGGLHYDTQSKIFDYQPNAHFNGTDSFEYRLLDVEGNYSEVVTVSITVNSVNDSPSTNFDKFDLSEDSQAIVLDILSNDSDVEQQPLTIELGELNSNGMWQGRSLQLSADGKSITYAPPANVHGTDWFTYRAVDSENAKSPFTRVELIVTPVNDAPIAYNTTVDAEEDVTRTFTPEYTDIDGDQVQFVVVAQPQFGTVTAVDGALRFAPTANFNGQTSFTYRVNDSALNSAVASITINVAPVNDLPTTTNYDLVSINEDSPGIFNGLKGTNDIDGDTLTLISAQADIGTALVRNASEFTYTPPKNYYTKPGEIVTVSLEVSDGGAPVPSQWTFVVHPIKDTPRIETLLWNSVDEFLERNFTKMQVRVYDMDYEQPISVKTSGLFAGLDIDVSYMEIHSSPGFYVYEIGQWEMEEKYYSPIEVTVVDNDGDSYTNLSHFFVSYDSATPNTVPDPANDQFPLIIAGYDTELDVLSNDNDDDGDDISVNEVDTNNDGVVDADDEDNPHRLRRGAADKYIVISPEVCFEGDVYFKYNITDGKDISEMSSVNASVYAFNNGIDTIPQTVSVSSSSFAFDENGTNSVNVSWERLDGYSYKMLVNGVVENDAIMQYQNYALSVDTPGDYSVSVAACKAGTLDCGCYSEPVQFSAYDLTVRNPRVLSGDITKDSTSTISWDNNKIAGQYWTVQKRNNDTGQSFATAATHLENNLFSEELNMLGTYEYRVRSCLANGTCGNWVDEIFVTVAADTASVDADRTVSLSTFTEDTASTKVALAAGEFKVNESGSATYYVPFDLPAGIAGVTPELGIGYSSSSGNGPLGLGWSISGLSSITRCTATIEEDGYAGYIGFNSDDRFCLNGQKLKEVALTNAANDSAHSDEALAEFRTEIDSKTRVVAFGSGASDRPDPEYFVVSHEDGSVSYYGAKDIKGVKQNSTLDTAKGTMAWMLVSTSDNMGKINPTTADNHIQFNYMNAATAADEYEILLDTVTYSKNTVDFKWSETDDVARPDQEKYYSHGSASLVTRYLKNVQVKNHNNALLRDYRLSYINLNRGTENSDGVKDSEKPFSQIWKIAECYSTDNDDCLSPTEFDYYETPVFKRENFRARNGVKTLGENTFANSIPVDLNNDGYVDLLTLTYQSSTNNPLQRTYELHVSLNNNGTLDDFYTIHEFGYDLEDNSMESMQIFPADINADGIPEIFFYKSVSGQDDAVWHYLMDNSSVGANVFSSDVEISLGISAPATDFYLHIVDVNADSLPDLVYNDAPLSKLGQNDAVRLNNAIGGFSVAYPINIGSVSGCKRFDENGCVAELGAFEATSTYLMRTGASDYNADGRADLTLINVAKNTFDPPLNLGNQLLAANLVEVFDGNGELESFDLEPVEVVVNDLVPEGTFISLSSGSPEWQYSHLLSADFNSDGLSDVFYVHTTLVEPNEYADIKYTGSGSSGREAISLTTNNGTYGRPKADDILSIQAIDLNKDNRLDLLFYNKKENHSGWYSIFQNRDGSFTEPSLYYGTANYKEGDNPLIADWNADGELGLGYVSKSSRGLTVIDDNFTRNIPARALHTVTNGFGLTTTLEYKQLTDPTVYLKGTGADDLQIGRCELLNIKSAENCSPVYDLINPGFVVSKVTSQSVGFDYKGTDRGMNFDPISGNEGDLSVIYFYEGLRAQAGGRGSLGFETIYSTDVNRNITTYTTYRQDFPYVGMPSASVQYMGTRVNAGDESGSKKLSDAENEYDFLYFRGDSTLPNDASTYFPYVHKSTELLLGVDNSATRVRGTGSIVTDNEYVAFFDNHANLRSSTVTYKSGSGSSATDLKVVTTTNQYNADDLSKWWLGRITESDVSHSYNEENDYRLSRFTYSSTTGLLEREIILPNPLSSSTTPDEQLFLTTLHCYDTAGNETDIFTYSIHHSVDCSTSQVPTSSNEYQVYRHKSYKYDSDKRYLTSVSNALFTEQEFSGFNKFGQAQTITDTNGVTTTLKFDSRGVQYASQTSTGQRQRTIRAKMDNIPDNFGAPSNFTPVNAYYVEKISSCDDADAACGSSSPEAVAPTLFNYYDKLGRLVVTATEAFETENGTVSPGDFVYTYIYMDVLGREIGRSNPTFDEQSGTQTHFDLLNRPTDIYTNYEDSDFKTHSEMNYGSNGLSVSSTTEFVGNASTTQKVRTTETRNILDERVSVSQSDFIAGDSASSLTTISYTYHPAGALHTAGMAGEITTSVVDDYGRKTSMQDKDKGNWSYTYNALGELVTQVKHGTNGESVVTSYLRDAVGRTVSRQDYKMSSGGSATDKENALFIFDSTDGAEHQLLKECFAVQGSSTVCDNDKIVKVYGYDGDGRPSTVTTTIGSGVNAQTVITRTTYDEMGRVYQVFEDDNTKHGIQYEYKKGYLHKQWEARYGTGSTSNKKVYYEVKVRDAFGNVTEFEQNNGLLKTVNEYETVNGSQKTNEVSSGGVTIQNNEFRFDALGNLRKRFRLALFEGATVVINGVEQGITRQGFRYDALSRFTQLRHNSGYSDESDPTKRNAVVQGWSNRGYDTWVTYHANGNIKTKIDAIAGGTGSYCYNSTRPHAVTNVVSSGTSCSSGAYEYDAWGNMTSGKGREITYNLFDKAEFISSSATENTTFDYGTNRSRYQRISRVKNGEGVIEATRTLYFGSQEKVYKLDDTGEWELSETRRNLPSATQTIYPSLLARTYYKHKDHLGSINTMTNDAGLIVQKLYFDAWGKKIKIDRRHWQWKVQTKAASKVDLMEILGFTTRGFTGHEHVDHADIIHMNGRIYDPSLGRFLQADPFIQAPHNSQSYNRYSYVLNNPLSYTDPSGYFFKPLRKLGRNIIRAAVKIFGEDVVNIAGNIGSLFCGPLAPICAGVWNYEFTRATGGTRAQALKGAFTSAASAFAFNAIGSHFRFQSAVNEFKKISTMKFGGLGLTGSQITQQIAAHAVVGGVAAVIQGGKFGHGFLSAGVTKGLGGAFLPGASDNPSTGEVIQGTFASAIIGGTASVITGGKFSNGARTASLQYLFNQVAKSKIVGRVIGGRVYHVKKYECATAMCVAMQANVPVEGNEEYWGAVLQSDKENLTDALTVGSMALGGAGLYFNSLRIYFWSVGFSATNLAINPNDPNSFHSFVLTSAAPPLKIIDETIALGVSSYQVLIESGLAADRFFGEGK